MHTHKHTQAYAHTHMLTHTQVCIHIKAHTHTPPEGLSNAHSDFFHIEVKACSTSWCECCWGKDQHYSNTDTLLKGFKAFNVVQLHPTKRTHTHTVWVMQSLSDRNLYTPNEWRRSLNRTKGALSVRALEHSVQLFHICITQIKQAAFLLSLSHTAPS